jgi:hypothetical protein
LRRRKLIYHAMPGWNAFPLLRRSSVKLRFLGNQQLTPCAANSFPETIARAAIVWFTQSDINRAQSQFFEIAAE